MGSETAWSLIDINARLDAANPYTHFLVIYWQYAI